MNKANVEIRQAIERKRIRHYEIAKKLGISPYTFSVWLRYELTPEKKEKVLGVINDYEF